MKTLAAIIAAMTISTSSMAAERANDCTIQFNDGHETVTDQCNGLNWQLINNIYSIYVMSNDHLIILSGDKNKNVKRKDHVLFDGSFFHVQVFSKTDKKKIANYDVDGRCQIQYNKAIACEGGDVLLNALLEENSTK